MSTHVSFEAIAARLRSALSNEVADQVFREVETAVARHLPADVLERRALALAAKGAPAAAIVGEIAGYHRALWFGREALRAGGRANPMHAEVEAAAWVLQQGADATAVSRLIERVPAGRSLEASLLVLASLLERGLPADDILSALHIWLAGDASDEELRDLAGPSPRPELTVVRAGRSVPLPRRQRP